MVLISVFVFTGTAHPDLRSFTQTYECSTTPGFGLDNEAEAFSGRAIIGIEL